MNQEFLFVEKYRPQNIEDTILPESIKSTFREFVKQEQIPNLMLCGSAGCGKTTIAKAFIYNAQTILRMKQCFQATYAVKNRRK